MHSKICMRIEGGMKVGSVEYKGREGFSEVGQSWDLPCSGWMEQTGN